jgi:hypothetical protein
MLMLWWWVRAQQSAVVQEPSSGAACGGRNFRGDRDGAALHPHTPRRVQAAAPVARPQHPEYRLLLFFAVAVADGQSARYALSSARWTDGWTVVAPRPRARFLKGKACELNLAHMRGCVGGWVVGGLGVAAGGRWPRRQRGADGPRRRGAALQRRAGTGDGGSGDDHAAGPESCILISRPPLGLDFRRCAAGLLSRIHSRVRGAGVSLTGGDDARARSVRQALASGVSRDREIQRIRHYYIINNN